MGNKELRKERKKARSKDPVDIEVAKLRKAIRRLESDKRQLLSEVHTLTIAFEKNIQFLKGETKDLTMGELVKAAKTELTLNQVKDQKEYTFSEMEKTWKCFKCPDGVMTLLVFQNMDGKQYLRCCSNKKCANRTKPKPWNDNVKGIRPQPVTSAKKKPSGQQDKK